MNYQCIILLHNIMLINRFCVLFLWSIIRLWCRPSLIRHNSYWSLIFLWDKPIKVAKYFFKDEKLSSWIFFSLFSLFQKTLLGFCFGLMLFLFWPSSPPIYTEHTVSTYLHKEDWGTLKLWQYKKGRSFFCGVPKFCHS